MGQHVSIHGPDGTFAAYLAEPASGQGPGIVVLQEIFGVNAVVRDLADHLSGLGYFALAPDLFWRLQPGVDISDRTDREWQQAFALMNRFDPEAGVADIKATIAHLRARDGVAKVGALGHCLGGLMAFLTAARTDSDATVGYYGVNIQDRLAEADQIAKPLLLHIAGEDGFVPAPAREKILAGVKHNALVTPYVYAGVDHAFARPGGKNFNMSAAAAANARTEAFFHQHLAPHPD